MVFPKPGTQVIQRRRVGDEELVKIILGKYLSKSHHFTIRSFHLSHDYKMILVIFFMRVRVVKTTAEMLGLLHGLKLPYKIRVYIMYEGSSATGINPQ